MPSDTTENVFKVRLTSSISISAIRPTTVAFDVSPNISENRNVNYVSLEPLHAPGQIQVYKNTSSRNFQISDVKLISRTIEEADKNMEDLWTLRSWCMPRFGNSSSLTNSQVNKRTDRAEKTEKKFKKTSRQAPGRNGEVIVGTQLLGAPPPILYLSAYSKDILSKTQGDIQTREDSIRGKKSPVDRWLVAQHINRVPVVIQQLTIPYPNDVDYITTSDGTPMPIIMNLDIALVETHSPNSYEAFSLDDFSEGRLKGY